MLYRNRKTKPSVVTEEKVEKFEKVVLEEPAKKPLEPMKASPISDNELSVSMKKLADMMAESSARQQEILEFLKGKESKSKEQPNPV